MQNNHSLLCRLGPRQKVSLGSRLFGVVSRAEAVIVSASAPTETCSVCLIEGWIAVCLAANPVEASALPSAGDCWAVRLVDLGLQVLGSSTTGHLLLGPCSMQSCINEFL